jgi:hypothetical protein
MLISALVPELKELFLLLCRNLPLLVCKSLNTCHDTSTLLERPCRNALATSHEKACNPMNVQYSETAPMNAPSMDACCNLWLCCGWTSTELISGLTLISQFFCQTFFYKCDYHEGILMQILGFCKLYFPLAMLVLLCVPDVQTNNNEFNWREKKNNFLVHMNKRYANLPRKQKYLNWKNIVNQIHKQIVKELKLNVNCHIKIGKNHNLLQV